MTISAPLSFAAAMLLSAAAAAAQAQDTATVAWDVELRLTTDQRSRGISDSLLGPSVRLSVQLAHESGLIGLLELSSVSKKQFLDGAGLAVVAAAGYRFGDPDGWHGGVGAAVELFPGAGFVAPHGIDPVTFTPLDPRRTRYDSHFVLLEAGYGALESRFLSVVSSSYRGADTGGVCGQLLQLDADPMVGLSCYARGDHGSRGTWLADLNYRVDLQPQTTLNLHVGRQKVNHFSEADTTDYAVGLTHRRWGYAFSAEALAVNTRARALYLVPDGDRLRVTDNHKLVFSVSRKF